MLSIQTNVNSMNAQENLRNTNLFQGRTIARLTSGYRINESGDDAAGLAVANKFRSDVAELSQGVRNANDGLSTMQIIDGGLSNISKMLDRLKTLATQSASSTFTGSRATLNQEYGSLLSEIDRQASNVGLGNDAGTSSRYNKKLNVYIGGGGDQSVNSGVMVDLSASTDKVSASSLGINGTTINGGAMVAQTSSRTDLTTAIILKNNASQAIVVNVEGQTKTVTINGGANGVSAYDAVNYLNSQVASMGISAVIDSTTGKLSWVSTKAYSVQAANSNVAGTGLTTAAGNVVNTSMYRNDGQTDFDTIATASDQEILNFQLVSSGKSVQATITDTTGATLQGAIDTLNTQINSLGIYATRNNTGNGISFFSASDFTVAVDASSNEAAGEGVYAAAAGATAAYTTTPSDTQAAEQAIAGITTAVARLGVVQGKVGTAQNKISYAIQLAQSQITSFSAAESRIRDADVASEAANLTKAQVLQQASLAALAQANSAPQAVLSLLRG